MASPDWGGGAVQRKGSTGSRGQGTAAGLCPHSLLSYKPQGTALTLLGLSFLIG